MNRAYRIIGKLAVFLAALLVLAFLSVLFRRLTGWNADFAVGWLMGLLFVYLDRPIPTKETDRG